MTSPPHWVDDLFPFPTPPALALLIDVAWETAFIDEAVYDEGLLETHFDFMFDLAVVPRAPEGFDYSYPGPSSRLPGPAPLFATPELLPFGHLGDGTHVGWVMPAPELGVTDHPVALFGQEPGARVIGRNTRAGLEFMLSLGLRKESLNDGDRALIASLAATLDLHPTPESGVKDGHDVEVPLDLVVPAGWRHEPGGYGIGVLAPADAFTSAGPTSSDQLADILTDTTRLLAAGFPATALLGVVDAFHDDIESFLELRPLWARAYRDLNRPQYAERLDLMIPTYE